MPDIYSAAQVADILGIAHTYVRKWLKGHGVEKTLGSYHISAKKLERLKKLRTGTSNAKKRAGGAA